MLSQELGPSPHSDSIMAALFVFASGSDWLCLEDAYVPLYLWSQSAAIDKALFQHLLSTAPSTRSWALLSALPHTGVGLHLQDQEFCFLYAIGMEWLYTAPPTPALNATVQLILLVTTNLVVRRGGNGDKITKHNAIQDVIFIVLPNLLPWLLLPT